MALIPFTGIYLIITEYVTVLICGLSPVSPSNTCVAQSAASVAVCLASSDSWLAVCGVFCRQCRSLLRVAAVPHWAKYFAIDDGHLKKMLDILISFLGIEGFKCFWFYRSVKLCFSGEDIPCWKCFGYDVVLLSIDIRTKSKGIE